MTALNFILTEQAVFVLTDSLTLEGGSANRGEARGFFTKVFPLPHMNAAIVGTGVAQVVLDWFLEIQTMVVSDSVAFLDTVAPARLREIAGRYPSAMTTTLYHFGLHGATPAFVGYAYRETHRFESERLPYSFGIKPPLPAFLERFPKALEEGSLRDAFVELLTAQKDDDDGKPLQERVGVGGEAHLLVIWRGRQMMWTCHRFADYPVVYRKVLARLADDARTET